MLVCKKFFNIYLVTNFWGEKLNPVFLFQVENVVVEIPMPKLVLNMTLNPSQGKYTFDPVSKVMVWEIGRIEPGRMPNIRGSVSKTFKI